MLCCGAQGPHATPEPSLWRGWRLPVSSWVFAALRPWFSRRCPRRHGYPRIFLLVNSPHGTSFPPEVLRVATPQEMLRGQRPRAGQAVPRVLSPQPCWQPDLLQAEQI